MTSLSTDSRKSWLLSKACKGLDVPEDLCEALLSEDKAQIDLSTFLDGGDQIVLCVASMRDSALARLC